MKRCKSPLFSVPAALLLCLGLPGLALAAPPTAAPSAPREPKESTLHGDRRVDDYAWLRDRQSPRVLQYLKDENAFADAFLKSSAALQQALYKESVARTPPTDTTVPYREGDFLYYARTEKGKQYPVWCRKPAEGAAREQILLDGNALGQKAGFFGLLRPGLVVSPDGNLLAYGLDTTGGRHYTLSIKDLRTGQPGPEKIDERRSASLRTIEDVASLAWADATNLFYVTEDAVRRASRLYHHVVGGAAADRLVYEEKDPRFGLRIERTRSGAYLLLSASSESSSEVRFLKTAEPGGAWTVIAAREPGHEYEVDHGLAMPGHESPKAPPKPAPGQKITVSAELGEDLFFIRTNLSGKNFGLSVARPADPGKTSWLEVLPPSDDAVLEDLYVFSDHFVVLERLDGLPRIRVTERQNGSARRLVFPEALYSVQAGDNRTYKTQSFRFQIQTITKPILVFDHDMVKHQNQQLKEVAVPGGYDPARYETERRKAKAPDGTEVAVSLVYKKGLARDGKAPLLLTGYGAYGYPYKIAFSTPVLSLLDRGVVYAVAHVRGGGEGGRKWYDAGRRLNKKNSFADFVAVADFLIAEKYTAAGRIVSLGRSAGGLLVTAAAQQRPELFRAVVADVPFVDVINTMLDETIPGTGEEFEEWGNPKVKAEYDYMKTYSPYDNLAAREYPAMLVQGALNDSQVMYWEPAKYVARLRALKTDKNPLLLRVNLAPAGHAGPSGRYDHLRDQSIVNAWILQQLGIRK